MTPADSLPCIVCGKPVPETDAALDTRPDLHIDCEPEYWQVRAEDAMDARADDARYADMAADADSDTAVNEGGAS